ncbi:hypothetical protein M3Y98_01045500 [Aphelenchoides besseyi]|nr:hypothetical protein M3Y98_01045500 [Aphelenchoides besseyi]KAI6209837.1 hypothetical protein M3Y96_00263500 [Aphelenchoides besseyi]
MVTQTIEPTQPQALNGRPPSLTLGYPILFTGVLHCRHDAITNLLRKRFGDTLNINGMDIYRDCWYLYVNSLHQVNEIMLRMDTLSFFGGRLCVRFVTEDGSLLDLSQLNRYIENGFGDRPRKKFDKSNEFTAMELKFLNDIFDVLHQLPFRFTQGFPYERALRIYRHANQLNMPEAIRIVLRDTPQILASITMQGTYLDDNGYLHLNGHPKLHGMKRPTPAEKQELESWEPFSATQITNSDKLVDYMHAMFGEFGPMNVNFDLRFRLATFLGRAYFQAPQTARELALFLERQSPNYVFLLDTIFDLEYREHRRLLRGHATGEFIRAADFTPAKFIEVTKYNKDRN